MKENNILRVSRNRNVDGRKTGDTSHSLFNQSSIEPIESQFMDHLGSPMKRSDQMYNSDLLRRVLLEAEITADLRKEIERELYKSLSESRSREDFEEVLKKEFSSDDEPPQRRRREKEEK